MSVSLARGGSSRQPGVVTSTTRPANPYIGQWIEETNTLRSLKWDGTGWIIMSEPWQSSTTLCITGVSLDGGLTSQTGFKRSDGYVDVESVTTFFSGPSTLASLAWVPPIAARTAAFNLPIGIGWDSLSVAYYDASAGGWFRGRNIEGTTTVGLYSDFTNAPTTTYNGIQPVTKTIPFAWTVSDAIRITGRYPMTTRYS